MQYNGLEVSPTVLGIALEGRKIEAIRLLREESPGFIGLKDAKDAVEAAMDAHDVSALRNSLHTAQSVAEQYRLSNGRLQQTLHDVQRDLADAQSDLRRLREVVSDHVLGIRLIVPLVERYDPSDDSPF